MFLKSLCVKDIPVAINTLVMGAESFCCYTADGSYHFYVTDHLGNVRAVTDASGTIEKTFDYDPFGESYESMVFSHLVRQEWVSRTKNYIQFTNNYDV